MTDTHEGKIQLTRALKSRHIFMLSLGGVIGTGLFMGSGVTINQGGPMGAILAYLVAGLLMYLVMVCLGELSVQMPVSGSFQAHATKFIGPATGFMIGWVYWMSWATTVGLEFTAAGMLMQRWFPDVPIWYWSALFVVVLFGLNALATRAFGEAEFWFALIKVVTILALVVGGDQRHRHRRQAEEAAFHRRRHGAGIDHVVAEIRGVVDARHHDVRLELQHAGQRQVHAVGRRAGDAAGVVVDALQPDRQVERQRVAGAGAVAVGGDHHHFMAGLAQHGGEHPDAGGIDAVVVADQDPHLGFNRLIVQDFISITFQRWRGRPSPVSGSPTAQVRQLLCRKRADRPTPAGGRHGRFRALGCTHVTS